MCLSAPEVDGITVQGGGWSGRICKKKIAEPQQKKNCSEVILRRANARNVS